MVEPRRRCYSMPAVDLYKKAVGGTVYVTVISANKLSKVNCARSQQCLINGYVEENHCTLMQTFVEVELEDLTRRTGMKSGTGPIWDSTHNMVLHDDTGIVKFHLYECTSGSVNYVYLTSCEIKVLALNRGILYYQANVVEVDLQIILLRNCF